MFGGSMNFDSNATVDDGSCVSAIWGCTIQGSFNYDPTATFGSGLLSDGTSCGYTDCMCISNNFGCTDVAADNYVALVNEMIDVNTEDGSCTYFGCTDPTATNYSLIFAGSTVNGPNGNYTYLNGNAVDDGSCTYIGGCMDATACNYDATATIDNGSCNYCGDNNAVNYDTTTPDYSCISSCDYCNDVVSATITSQTTADAGMNNGEVVIEWPASTSSSVSSYVISGGGIPAISITPSGNSTETYTITGLGTGTYPLYISTFCTADSGAQLLAGLYLPGGVMGVGLNFGIPVTVTITSTPVFGCTDAGGVGTSNPNGSWAACNYDAVANTDDGSCDYTVCTGCNDNTFLEFCGDCWDTINQAIVTSGGNAWVADTVPTSCLTSIIPGCMDATAFNFDATATVDDGSCIPIIYGCMDATTNNDGSWAASNYSAAANTDDGSCYPYNCPYDINITQGFLQVNTNPLTQFKIMNYQTPYAFSSITRQATFTSQSQGTAVLNLSQYSTIFQGSITVGRRYKAFTNPYFSPGDTYIDVQLDVTTTDGNCILSAQDQYSIGCTNAAAVNFGAFDIMDDTQCEYSGCMDSLACNYDSSATVDDGSCQIPGCTDSTATNYNSSACPDDGSCIIPGCTDGTLNADGSGSYAASNYNANATVSCNDGTGDNSCCNYAGDPSVTHLYRTTPAGSSAFQHLFAYTDNANTAYDQAQVTAIDLGTPGGASVTYSGASVAPWFLPPAAFGNGPVAFGNTLFQSAWAPYTDITGAYGQNSGDITATFHVDWTGTLDNPSMNNTITTSTSDTFVYSAGCKTGNNSHVNWNNSLDFHINNSCVAGNPGCMDSTATNYDAAFNQDCTESGSTNPNDCCCYACDAPVWDVDPVTSIIWDSTTSPTFATQFQLEWSTVNTAASYTVWAILGGNVLEYAQLNPSVVNGVATYTINNSDSASFNSGDTYVFYIQSNCSNADGDSCHSSSIVNVAHEFNCNC
tara:strand:- start:728 stop:3664 length:2937 start_codon:yes stop_codon:yes gene_type:complete